jgi:hypothetical protein
MLDRLVYLIPQRSVWAVPSLCTHVSLKVVFGFEIKNTAASQLKLASNYLSVSQEKEISM